MGISKPEVLEVGYRTLAINEFGMAACFLLWGDERGLLIDTGCGMYNIRAIADELCPLPYDVVITHAHGDHLGSIDKWDEIYIHENDLPALAPETFFSDYMVNRFNTYTDRMAPFGPFEAYDITPAQIHHPETLPAKIHGIKEGHVFHLGGRDIDVVLVPGHTAGEIVLFDPKERILFSGDACNVNLGLGDTSINTTLKGLLKIKARENEFDRNFNGHIGYGGNTVNRSMPEAVLDDCIFLCRSILAGTAEVKTVQTTRGPKAMVQHGTVRINYDPERLIDEGEEPIK